MTDRPVCQMCSWLGETGRGRSWAKWRWTYEDGTSQLVCARHQAQAMRVGGHGQPIEELHGLVFAPSTIDRTVAESARPLTIVQQVLVGLRSQIRAELRDYLRGAMLYVDFEDEGEARQPAERTRPRARRRAS